MLNCQMFSTKKLATHHLASLNKLPKGHVSNLAKNSPAKSVPHYELTGIKKSWFHLRMGENCIPKVEWQIISKLPNQASASKTSATSHAYCSSFQKFNDANDLSIQLHMQKIMNFRRNSKWKFQNKNKNGIYVWS